MTGILRELLHRGVLVARMLQIYPYGFRGDFRSWDDALRTAGCDYHAPQIAEKNVKTTKLLEKATAEGAVYTDAGTKRIVDTLIMAGASKSDVIDVLDFGGALGRHFFSVRNSLPSDLKVKWTVWETPTMAETGKHHFERPDLQFVSSPDELAPTYDLALASGSLQYADQPWEMLRLLRSLAPRLIVDRLPLNPAPQDRLTVQRVPPWIYRASYPAWFLSEMRWNEEVGSDVRQSWDSGETVWLGRREVRNRGVLLEASHGAPRRDS